MGYNWTLLCALRVFLNNDKEAFQKKNSHSVYENVYNSNLYYYYRNCVLPNKRIGINPSNPRSRYDEYICSRHCKTKIEKAKSSTTRYYYDMEYDLYMVPVILWIWQFGTSKLWIQSVRYRPDIIVHKSNIGKGREESTIHTVVEAKFQNTSGKYIWYDYLKLLSYRNLNPNIEHLNLVLYPTRTKHIQQKFVKQSSDFWIPGNLITYQQNDGFKEWWKEEFRKKNHACQNNGVVIELERYSTKKQVGNIIVIVPFRGANLKQRQNKFKFVMGLVAENNIVDNESKRIVAKKDMKKIIMGERRTFLKINMLKGSVEKIIDLDDNSWESNNNDKELKNFLTAEKYEIIYYPLHHFDYEQRAKM